MSCERIILGASRKIEINVLKILSESYYIDFPKIKIYYAMKCTKTNSQFIIFMLNKQIKILLGIAATDCEV